MQVEAAGSAVSGTQDPERGRRPPRIPSPPVAAEGEWAAVRDIGLGGICLAHPAPLARGTRCSLALEDVFSGEAAELSGEVIWSRDGLAGLGWVDLEPDRLDWLKERCREW